MNPRSRRNLTPGPKKNPKGPSFEVEQVGPPPPPEEPTRGRAENLTGGNQGNVESLWKAREREERIRRRVIEDPDASSESIYVSFALATKIQIERWLRSGREPDDLLIDAIREFRALTRDLLEAKRSAGAVVEARAFFDTVQKMTADVTLETFPVVEVVLEDLHWEATEQAESTEEDPDRALEQIHASLTIGTKKIVDRWLRERGGPSRMVVSALREFRQTTRDVLDLRKARGALTEAEQVFASLPARVEAAQEYLEAQPA